MICFAFGNATLLKPPPSVFSPSAGLQEGRGGGHPGGLRRLGEEGPRAQGAGAQHRWRGLCRAGGALQRLRPRFLEESSADEVAVGVELFGVGLGDWLRLV